MAVIGINYNESGRENPLGYKSVYISLKSGEEIVFDSGNFIVDWYDAKKHFVHNVSETESFLAQSSSVDHFIMDGAPFHSAYLHFEDNNPILKYVDKTDGNWFVSQMDVFEKGMELFVKEGEHPTWEELKEYCKQK